MKNRWIPLLALVAAVVAYLLTLFYQDRFRREITRGMKQVEIVVASRDVASGTVITTDDLGKKTVFESGLTRRAVEVDQLRDIVGKRITTSLTRGDPVYWSDLDLPRLGRGGLQASVQKGERALSISVDQVSSVTGLVRPNDHVDIVGTFTFPPTAEGGQPEAATVTLLQDVTVLATGAVMGRRLFQEGPEGRMTGAGRYSTVTLAVTPEEAELLVFATQQGRLTLTLRNSEDVAAPSEMPQINFQYLIEQLQRINEERGARIRNPEGA